MKDTMKEIGLREIDDMEVATMMSEIIHSAKRDYINAYIDIRNLKRTRNRGAYYEYRMKKLQEALDDAKIFFESDLFATVLESVGQSNMDGYFDYLNKLAETEFEDRKKGEGKW